MLSLLQFICRTKICNSLRVKMPKKCIETVFKFIFTYHHFRYIANICNNHHQEDDPSERLLGHMQDSVEGELVQGGKRDDSQPCLFFFLNCKLK